MTEVEVWKDIPFNDNYQISSFGRIFSKRRKKMLSTSNGDDYPRIRISNKNYKVHRLVWEIFKGSIPDSQVIRHIDGERTNCKLSNLDIGTMSDNKLDHLKFREEMGFVDEVSHIEGEEWRSSGYDRYEVSNFGRVKSLKRNPEKILKPHKRNGYVGYCLMIGNKPTTLCAHTLVYDAFIGRVPEGKIIRHLDGNRKNNRVENLTLGTYRDNVLDDMKNCVRSATSTPELAKRVVELRNEGKTAGEIQKEVQLDYRAINNILYRGTWGVERPKFTGRSAQRKITDEQVKEVFELRSKGLLHREIAKELGISRQHVGDILNGRKRNKDY